MAFQDEQVPPPEENFREGEPPPDTEQPPETEPPPVEEPPVELPVETLHAQQVPPGLPPDPDACDPVPQQGKCEKCGWSSEDPETRDNPHPMY